MEKFLFVFWAVSSICLILKFIICPSGGIQEFLKFDPTKEDK